MSYKLSPADRAIIELFSIHRVSIAQSIDNAPARDNQNHAFDFMLCMEYVAMYYKYHEVIGPRKRTVDTMSSTMIMLLTLFVPHVNKEVDAVVQMKEKEAQKPLDEATVTWHSINSNTKPS